MQVWVLFVLLAAFMQVIRTGLQKVLAEKLNTMSVTWVRAGFGVPLAGLYFAILAWFGLYIPQLNLIFLLFAVAGSISQIIGTALLVALFSQRNFAIATIYHKTDAIQAAIFGLLLFGENLSTGSLIAVAIGFVGIITISGVKSSEFKIGGGLKGILMNLTSQSALIGLGSGLGAALAGLFFRFASLSLAGDSLIMNASVTLLVALVIQTVLLGGYLLYKDTQCFNLIFAYFKPSALVGLTSMLGSVGWFTALSMIEAATVKTVGQIEVLFAIVISRKIFREKISKLELLGITLIVLSIILLLKVQS